MFDEKLIATIKATLVEHEETIAVAESVTSGLLQSAFASAENASLFFQGGITTYNLGQKARHLNVEPIHALTNNCVSEKIAEQMALNVSVMFHSDWGIAVTGYASPVPESGNKLFAYYSIVFKNEILKTARLEPEKMEPEEVQRFYIEEILKQFHKIIVKESEK
ncbi:MAG: CinA family protein [Cytophaga sp.]|uniref:CinA family protein n=1 Tax=Cytophaga sp. TaxID=29535 RepID=UPI003F801CD2